MAYAGQSAWSCFTKGPSVDEALTYGDVIGRRYEYDSQVVHSSQVAVGDIVVLRDADLIYGFGVVDSIRTWPATKLMQRCPHCRSSKLTRRTTAALPFRCSHCKHEFLEPLEEPRAVTAYSASYEPWWFPFGSPVPVRALISLYTGEDRRNAIRRLDTERTFGLLAFHGDVESVLFLQLQEHAGAIPGGRVDAIGKRRIGQQQFRERLFDRYGPVCAVTGEQPEEILDTAHLFTFAERPEHVETAGLLLRADVHRLFDRLLLCIDPESWQSRVAPRLLVRYPLLAELDRRPLSIAAGTRPDASWVEQHWSSAHQRWRRAARTG